MSSVIMSPSPKKSANLLNYRFSQLGKFSSYYKMKLAKKSKTLRVDQPKLFRLDVLQNLNAYSALRSSIETNHRDPQRYPPGPKKMQFL